MAHEGESAREETGARAQRGTTARGSARGAGAHHGQLEGHELHGLGPDDVAHDLQRRRVHRHVEDVSDKADDEALRGEAAREGAPQRAEQERESHRHGHEPAGRSGRRSQPLGRKS